MRSRPWPIILIALLQLAMPFVTIALASTFYSMSFMAYIRTLSYLKSPLEFRLFFLLPVLSSVALFAVRRWSYPVFLGTVVWGLYNDLTHWTMSSTVFPTAVLISSYVFNIAIVSYLMLPTVWALYFDPKFAWWRSKTRYLLSHVGEMKGGHGFTDCKLLDISRGGAFIESAWDLDGTDDLILTFNYSGLTFTSKARLIHKTKRGVVSYGYGLEFKNMDRGNSRVLRQIINSLKALNLELTPKGADRTESFVGWIIHLLSTGHGLVPVIPATHLKSKKAAHSEPTKRAA